VKTPLRPIPEVIQQTFSGPKLLETHSAKSGVNIFPNLTFGGMGTKKMQGQALTGIMNLATNVTRNFQEEIGQGRGLPIGTDIGKRGATHLVHFISKPLALQSDIMNPIRETKTATKLKYRKIA